MVDFTMLKSRLPFKKSFSSDPYLDKQPQQLLEWAANLSKQTEAHQAFKLEQMLTKLATADVEDQQRLSLMTVVSTALDRLVPSLHSHYLYEPDTLEGNSLNYAMQVKSLYYLSLLVYDPIIRNQQLLTQRSLLSTSGWKRYFGSTKQPPLLLAAAIYQTLMYYQKLLFEKGVCYQKSPEHLWSALNQLYYLACQQDIAHINLNIQVATPQADSIHDLYVQMCLYSLLNIRAMHRPNIVLMQRLLPVWRQQISTTLKPQTQMPVFVDLHGDSPPQYLSAQTTINPFDDTHDCLFIELAPLARYLAQRKQYLDYNRHETSEYHLINQALTLINYRYLQRPNLAVISNETQSGETVSEASSSEDNNNQTNSVESRSIADNSSGENSLKKSTNQQHKWHAKNFPQIEGEVITKFANIHYHVTGNISLTELISASSLPTEHQPRYDTQPTLDSKIVPLKVTTPDSKDSASEFRTLRIKAESKLQNSAPKMGIKLSTRTFKETQKSADRLPKSLTAALSELSRDIDKDIATKVLSPITTPPLQIESLLLLSHANIDNKPKFSLGVVRWLNLDDEDSEVEWQLLGHSLTACAIRLNNHNASNISYVPAFIIAGDHNLHSKNTLLVPSYHFHTRDKAIIRLKQQQKTLRLQRCIMSTKTFSQYEFALIQI